MVKANGIRLDVAPAEPFLPAAEMREVCRTGDMRADPAHLVVREDGPAATVPAEPDA